MPARREQREKEILNQLKRLISDDASEKSLLDLRMSEVAATASVSVGTLYSHFACKEDLIIGLAMDSVLARLDAVQNTLKHSNYDEPLMRFLLAQIAGWKHARENTALMEMEFLAMSKSIWKRASERIRRDLWDKHDEFGHLFNGLMRDAANQLNVAGSDGVAHHFEIGVWALSIGMDVIASSRMIRGSILSPKEWTNYQLENLTNLLVGWGWPREELESAARNLSIPVTFDDVSAAR